MMYVVFKCVRSDVRKLPVIQLTSIGLDEASFKLVPYSETRVVD